MINKKIKIEKIISSKELFKKIKEFSKSFEKKIANEKNIVFLVVLKGGINLAIHLSSFIKTKELSFEYIESSSYSKEKKIGKPKIALQKNLNSLKDKNIYLIDDLIDSGETVIEIINKLKTKKPLKIEVIVLFSNKKEVNNVKINAVFGKKPKGFLVGFGLDYIGELRNKNYIGIIKVNNFSKE